MVNERPFRNRLRALERKVAILELEMRDRWMKKRLKEEAESSAVPE